MKSMYRSIVLALAMWACTGAHADRPLVSETADAIGRGSCQLELAAMRSRSADASLVHGQDLFGSCGIGWNTQVGVLVAQEHGDGSRLRLLGLHGKTTLVMPEDGRVGWGIAYGLTSDHLSGDGWQHGSSHASLVATRQLPAGLIGHLNLGWERAMRDHADTTSWSAGLEGTSLGPFGWAVDIFGDDRSRPWLSGGLLLEINEKISLNLSLARQFDALRTRQWTLGGKIQF